MLCNGCGPWGDSPGTWFEDEVGSYCSLLCQSKFHKRINFRLPVDLVCEQCAAQFVSKRPKQKYCCEVCRLDANRERARERWEQGKALRPATKVWVCGWCNEDMVLPFSYKGTKAYHDECSVRARRQRNRIKNVRRQNNRVQGIRVDVEAVALRDGFVCHICGDGVDMSVARNSRYGATLDHVYPLSRGGEDSLDNLKLAHWICNVRKSDKLEDIDA